MCCKINPINRIIITNGERKVLNHNFPDSIKLKNSQAITWEFFCMPLPKAFGNAEFPVAAGTLPCLLAQEEYLVRELAS